MALAGVVTTPSSPGTNYASGLTQGIASSPGSAVSKTDIHLSTGWFGSDHASDSPADPVSRITFDAGSTATNPAAPAPKLKRDRNSLALNPVHFESVPEPSSLALLGITAAGLLRRKRRR